MTELSEFQKAIREENLDGWLFCNFSHRDLLTNRLLQIDSQQSCTRRWFYLIPAHGEPVQVVHGIESTILNHLSGKVITYYTREELLSTLSQWKSKTIAVFCDPDIPVLSTIDAGSYAMLLKLGLKLVSAAALIQRTAGVLNGADFDEHRQTATILYEIVDSAWQTICDRLRDGKNVFEGDIQDHILESFRSRGLITNHPPIVAFGAHSADPHYAPPELPSATGERGALLKENDVIQLDLWAKKPDAVYADISWVGFYGQTIPAAVSRAFEQICQARDMVTQTVKTAFLTGKALSGAALDQSCRDFLQNAGYAAAIRHRTGHGIDRECHGSGVNLDSVEFPDQRLLIEGSCFSVEPGLYFADFGLRTEINIYIKDGMSHISGGKPQTHILHVAPCRFAQEGP